MKHILKLIRYKNLLIIALTQVLMRYCIIDPLLHTAINSYELQLAPLFFILLICATTLIAAGGYIINDINDKSIDTLNKPDSLIVGKYISISHAYLLYYFFSLTGILCGFLTSLKIGNPSFGIVFVIISGFLWFYSDTYKKQLLIGNIIISLLAALVPFIVVVYEIVALNQVYAANFNYLLLWVSVFSLFSFLCTFTREITKDAEDFEGDASYGRNTIPIVFGMIVAKTIIFILLLITILTALYFIWNYLFVVPMYTIALVSYMYALLLIIIPLVYLLYIIITAQHKKDYTRASAIIKFTMITGVLFSILICLMLYQV